MNFCVTSLEFDISELPPQFIAYCELERLVFLATPESIENAKEVIKNNPILPSNIFICDLILQASRQRRFSFPILADLWAFLKPSNGTFNGSIRFVEYLYKRGLIKKESLKFIPNASKTIEEYEDVFPYNSIYYAVSKDDVNKVVFLSSTTNIKKERVTIDDSKVSLLTVAALCGSVRVFKYMIVNGCTIDRDTAEHALMGGSEQIVEIIAQHNYNYNYCLKIAIEAHHNHLANWLIDNYKCEEIHPLTCIFCFNTLAFCYFVSKGANIEAKDGLGNTPLLWASEFGHLEMVKYLISKGANIETSDVWIPSFFYRSKKIIFLMEILHLLKLHKKES